MNIKLLMTLFECISAIAIIVSVYKVVDSYKWWILYVLSSVLYVVTCTYNGLYWYALMGFILLLTGIKNYRVGKNKEINKEK